MIFLNNVMLNVNNFYIYILKSNYYFLLHFLVILDPILRNSQKSMNLLDFEIVLRKNPITLDTSS